MTSKDAAAASRPGVVRPVSSSSPISAWQVVVLTTWAACLILLAGAVPMPLRALLMLLVVSTLVALLSRLMGRKCYPHAAGLTVRGFWRSYDVPWAAIERVQASRFEPRYMWFFGARVFVVFRDQVGRRRAVCVSSNRRDVTAEYKAHMVVGSMPEPWRSAVVVEQSFFTPEETVWEWRPVRASADETTPR